jgi:hypothetical protein
MLHELQQLPLNYNEFHVLSATPCNMECNMKQLSDEAEIVEWIVNELHPLRDSKTRAQAQDRVKLAIEMLRETNSRPFPRSDVIKKAAEKLRKAIEPLGDAQMPFWCGDRLITIHDALDWFKGLEGPSSKVDVLKHFVATQADCIVYEFSEEPPTGTVEGKVSGVASILYQAITGEAGVKLKHQIDAVRRSWRRDPNDELHRLDELRCRGIPRL